MKNYLFYLASFLIIMLAKFTPLSFIVGSQGAFFSGITTICLLTARHSSLGFFLFALMPVKILSLNSLFLFFCSRISLLVAGWSYRFSSIVTAVFVPIICLVLFVIHPVGQQAWPYALYWLFPIIIYFLKNENIFLRALQAVFIAHAIGSIIWLYVYQIEAGVWMGLIPLVAYERLLMALGVVIGEYSIGFVVSLKHKAQLFLNEKFA